MNDRMDDAAGAQRVARLAELHHAWMSGDNEDSWAEVIVDLEARLRAVEAENIRLKMITYPTPLERELQARLRAVEAWSESRRRILLEVRAQLVDEKKAAQAEARRLREENHQLRERALAAEALAPPRPVKHEHEWPTCWRGWSAEPPESCADCRQDV